MELQTQYGFNPPAPKDDSAMVPVESARAAQEVQAAMVIAKRFPRDQFESFQRIMKACERPKLAESAEYAYPKGGQTVSGPSIRLAEVLAQCWGNIDFGIKELSQANGESEVLAYCWDLETNARQTKTFKVTHKRKARGSFTTITDPRDIYEHVANYGARRLRACILGVIPGDVAEAAQAKCRETLRAGANGVPLEDRLRKMLVAFEKFGVSKPMIEARMGHNLDATIETEFLDLRKIFNSLKDGMSKREDWFKVKAAATTSDESDELTEQVQGLNGAEDTIPGVDQLPKQDADAKDWDKWLKSWINMRTPGFMPFVNGHLWKFEKAPDDIKARAKEKWEGLYPDEPWPLDPQPEPEAAETPPGPPPHETPDPQEEEPPWRPPGIKEPPVDTYDPEDPIDMKEWLDRQGKELVREAQLERKMGTGVYPATLAGMRVLCETVLAKL